MTQTPSDQVLVELMPAQYRASHQAAGSWGVYPHNGAKRVVMPRADAESECADDDYNHIVRDATDGDEDRYEVVL
jgi:hypothetical protein